MKHISFKDIYIPKPCNANWNKMQVTSNCSKHCSSCDKEVIDFTKLDEYQLNEILTKNEDVCGRFSDKQISQHLAYQKKSIIKRGGLKLKSLIAASIAFFTLNTSKAQNTKIFNKFNPEIIHNNLPNQQFRNVSHQTIIGNLITKDSNAIYTKVLVKFFIDDVFIGSTYSEYGEFSYIIKQRIKGEKLSIIVDEQKIIRKRAGAKRIYKIGESNNEFEFQHSNNVSIICDYKKKVRKNITYPFYSHWVGCPKFR